jgi:DNA-binding transcriptional MocR family regulator
MTDAQLHAHETEFNRELELFSANRLALDLSRGKPAPEQLDLSHDLEAQIDGNYMSVNGIDTRNYGNLRGIDEARELGADLLGVPSANVLAGGNSSLWLMHLVTSTALNQGVWNDERRWARSREVKILTPVPGYDRHFTLCDALGITTINVKMTDTGPDMDQVEALVAADPAIKGIWCVPKYSNPTGCIYSDDTVRRCAELARVSAADDFLVFWDNAYAVHDFSFPRSPLANIFSLAGAADTQDHVVLFASTSKITFAGSGVSFAGASETVLAAIEQALSVMIVGPDKVNQLRHARLLLGRVDEHMARHAEILKPKFDMVDEILERELTPLGLARWTKPEGGYFVSLDVMPGTASDTVGLAKTTGLTLTPAGATFPGGIDPDDSNIRIAPTFATLDELKTAMEVLVLCIKLTSVRKMLRTRQT